jgi:hypothetical protein
MTDDIRPKLKRVIINNVDVSDYIVRISADDEFDTYIGTAEIVVSRNITDILPLSIDISPGYKVTIQRGIETPDEEWIFRGEIISLKTDGSVYIINCNNRYYEAVRHSISYSFDKNIDTEDGVGSEIYKTLINDYTPLECDDNTVVNTGNSIILNKFECRNIDVYERCDKLGDIYNFQHYYDAEIDKTRFEPKGFVDGNEILEVGVNVIEVPQWVTDKTRIINTVTIKGAEQLVGYSQFFDGNNTDGQFFSLAYTPRSVKIYVGTGTFDPTGIGTKPSDNESNLKTGGKIGTTSGVFDYNYDDDKRIRRVYFYDPAKQNQPSFKPPVGIKNIEVQLTYSLPVQVKGSNEQSITDYGIHETQIEINDIKTFDDAFSYMESFLNFYSLPFISTTLKVANASSLKVGRVYRVIDPIEGIDKNLIVSKIKRQWPHKYDEVTIGNEILRELEFKLNVVDRLKRIEDAIAESDDLIVEMISLNTNFNLDPRYIKQERRKQEGFVIGHPFLGIIGTSLIGDNITEPLSVIYLAPGKNTFKEYIYDDEFYDDINSINTTWDINNNKITIQDTLYLKFITCNIDYQYFTTHINITGDYEITISNDNGLTWQQVLLNTRTSFNNITSDKILLKIEKIGPNDVIIETLKNSFDKTIEPAIKIIFE